MNFFRNNLDKAQSPYLKQHAQNPVFWQTWHRAVFEEAQRRDCLVILSIGYATCHWCHVMEHESFSDPLVAEVMNAHYLCIKVDREELPDVDAYYMDAVQAMGIPGGWPLNLILLSDGRPVFGGTYFPKQRWLRLLQDLAELYKSEKKRFLEYAEQLALALQEYGPTGSRVPQQTDESQLKEALNTLFQQFDTSYGGLKKAPKFPVPVWWNFVLDYALLHQRPDLADHVHFTLGKMALSGLRDHVEGGFFRYSTDAAWHIPHFEKMLYDNAQLISLFSRAYRHRHIPLYKDVVNTTTAWLEARLQLPNGLYASGLDADSAEGEGAYYTFREEELKNLGGTEFSYMAEALGILPELRWEGRYHVFPKKLFDAFPAEGKDATYYTHVWTALRTLRQDRPTPALDDKALLGWNALLVKAFVEAAWAFPKAGFEEKAQNLAQRLKDHFLSEKNRPLRCCYPDGTRISARSDDLALAIEAFIYLAALTGSDAHWQLAVQLMNLALETFGDPAEPFFRMTSLQENNLLPAPLYETEDSVIPSANAVMCGNLMYLGIFTGNTAWIENALRMLEAIRPMAYRYPGAHGLWLSWQSLLPEGPAISALTNRAPDKWMEVAQCYRPGVLPIKGSETSAWPFIAEKRRAPGSWHLCNVHTCLPPAAHFCASSED
ncbi:MAG: thioredoxin domain-containing protein [Flavobacteriales bacterium]|nr:thioredoxin domain-containing protein [Flavobacteriales bacterium]